MSALEFGLLAVEQWLDLKSESSPRNRRGFKSGMLQYCSPLMCQTCKGDNMCTHGAFKGTDLDFTSSQKTAGMFADHTSLLKGVQECLI